MAFSLVNFSLIFLFVIAFTTWRLSAPLLHRVPPVGIKQHQASDALQDPSGPFEQVSLIPRQIWQIYLQKRESDSGNSPDPNILADTTSWLALNEDYHYTLVGTTGGGAFVDRHFSNHPTITSVYHQLKNVGLKSDFLRYLLLSINGGVYSDIDTYAHKPIDQWLSPDLRHHVRLIVGIEFDRRGGVVWAEIPHYVQFCQWTIAAAPNHPVFPRMVDRVLSSLDELQQTYGRNLADLHPTSFEVLNSTGPAAWTDVVFSLLQEADPRLDSLEDLSGMTEPRLFGDILILPIDGFGMNQPHSHSTNDGTVPEMALVEHHFHGSWRGDTNESGQSSESNESNESNESSGN
ncbi:initiation-specific alpha-1,6-mannosyltransferase [Xylariomycetidae sp. FL0641]|nr:initiation-specific alpha-1,6-mannosyltransferase [Xylariomycetidae sp. FL0641]